MHSSRGMAMDAQGDIYVAAVSWSEYGRRMVPPRELRPKQKLVKVSKETKHYKRADWATAIIWKMLM